MARVFRWRRIASEVAQIAIDIAMQLDILHQEWRFKCLYLAVDADQLWFNTDRTDAVGQYLHGLQHLGQVLLLVWRLRRCRWSDSI